jgi:ABC-type sugar transport system permease subunit
MTRPLSTSHPRWAPYVFIAPFVLIFCTFMVYPLVQSIVLAMQQTFGPRTTVFVGLKNFADLFADPFFWLACVIPWCLPWLLWPCNCRYRSAWRCC